MSNKTKIELLNKYIQKKKGFDSLPPELRTEIILQANMLGVIREAGALICMRELQREEKDKKIIKIQEQQTKTLQEQKIFTKILALATLLLGLVAFFSFFNISIASMGPPTQNLFFKIFFAMLTGFGFCVLVMAFFVLIFEITKLFSKK